MWTPYPLSGRAALPRVLLVEDDDIRARAMVVAVPTAAWDRARSAKFAIKKLTDATTGRAAPYRAVFLDYDLAGPSGGGGQRVAAYLIQIGYAGIVVIHSANPTGGPIIYKMLEDRGHKPVYAPAFHPAAPDIWRQVVEHLIMNPGA